ncbi:hypothetical protein ACM66B_004057 [Microbotryomycetes sp. NB124-2]
MGDAHATGPSSFRALVNRDGTLPRDKLDWSRPNSHHWMPSAPSTARSSSPSSSSSSSSSSPSHPSRYTDTALIQVLGLDRSRLVFEGVVLNGLCSLRKLKLRNVSKRPVVVRLGSTVGDQLRWQLRNDNFAILPTELQHMATNTVAAIARLRDLPDTNAMFDSVGLVSEVTLDANETRDIIAAFRPDATHVQPATVSSETSHLTSAAKADTYSEQGLSSVSIAESSASSSVIGSDRRGPTSHNLATIDGFVNFDASPIVGGSGEHDITTPSDAVATPFVPVQSVSVELHATCCRSFFTLDVRGSDAVSHDEIFVDFASCRLGEQHTREFEVCNRSAVELFWRPDSVPPLFQIEDVETGASMASQTVASVASFSHKRYRLHFKPTEPAEIEEELLIENVADLDNSVSIHLHALVTAAPPDRTLKITSGAALDFGDCCSGVWHHQVVSFTNISAAPLEVSFAADKGHEITFRLDTSSAEDEAPETFDVDRAAIGANAVELPPVSVSEGQNDSTANVSADKSTSRTIIHELARGATVHSIGRGLLAGRPLLQGGSQTRSPSSVQSDGTFGSSEGLNPSQASSFDQPPRTYHSTTDPNRDFVHSPLSGNATSLAANNSTNPSEAEAGADSTTKNDVPVERAKLRLLGGGMRSENSERGLFRVQDHLKLLEQRSSATVDQIYAKPGLVYRIIVSYRPTRAQSIEADGGKLAKKSFRVNVSWRPWGSRGSSSSAPRERKVINCKARVCTSFIAVRPSTIDFGDVELGSAVQGTISITNLSEIPARVDLRFISKVLSAYRDEIEVAVGKTVDVKVDMVPRRTNPSYQKQVSVHNLLNPDNSQVCLIKAANVDTRGVAFHSLFYRLLTPTGGNFVEFGNVPLNSRALRAITIDNTSASPLAIRLAASQPDDYGLYLRKSESDVAATSSPTNRTECPPSPNPKTRTDAGSRNASSSSKKIDELKERVLDAIFQQLPDSAATGRQEHQASRAPSSQTSTTSSTGSGLAAQLREGEKGKPTQVTGKIVTFRDRGLLAGAEYLDLAINVPGRKGSPRGKHFGDIAKRALSRSRQNKNLLPPRIALNATQASQAGQPSDPFFVDASDKAASAAKPSLTVPKSPTVEDRQNVAAAPESASLPLTARRRTRHVSALPIDPNKVSLDEALVALEQHSGHPDSSELNTSELEEAYVRRQVALRRTLKGALEEGDLVEARDVELAPYAKRTIYIVLHPSGDRSNVQTSSRKQDGKISIHLERFTRSTVPGPGGAADDLLPDGGDIPVREVVLRWTSCRSQMELGMAHINFGQLEKSSSKSRTLLISNTSEMPLLYVVRKSGSIASGDLRLAQGRHGIVSGYGKREVSIVFEPHFAGAFEETIHIDNVEDETESEAVRVRAFIVRPPTFSVSTSVLEFGECDLDAAVRGQTIAITNVSSRQRTITVAVDSAAVSGTTARARLDVELDARASASKVRGPLSAEEEEEVENILQKLKISRRKGQADKAEKYVSRLNLLGVPVPEGEVATATVTSTKADGGGGETKNGDESVVQSATASEVVTPASLSPTSEVGNPMRLAQLAVSEAAVTAPATRSAGNGLEGSRELSRSADKDKSSAVTLVLEPSSRRELLVEVVARRASQLPTADNGQVEGSSLSSEMEDVSVTLVVSENADSKQTVTCRAKVLLKNLCS